jgi:protein involved in polysaccharide export with SLBB domain
MPRFHLAAMFLCAAGLCAGAARAQQLNQPRWHYSYHVAAGDGLELLVYDHPELSASLVVKDNGEVDLPWHATAQVAGLSREAISELLRQKLESVVGWSCIKLTVKKRAGSWVREYEPFFIDVPPPRRSPPATFAS